MRCHSVGCGTANQMRPAMPFGGRIAREGKRIRSNYSAFEKPEEFGTILVKRAFCLPQSQSVNERVF